MVKITKVLRDAVCGYLLSENIDDQLSCFNKLVNICMVNTLKLFIPTRTVGIGVVGKRYKKDNLVRDLAEEFVLESLSIWVGMPQNEVHRAVNEGKFDYMGNAFKQFAIKHIRRVNSKGEEALCDLFDEGYDDEGEERY